MCPVEWALDDGRHAGGRASYRRRCQLCRGDRRRLDQKLVLGPADRGRVGPARLHQHCVPRKSSSRGRVVKVVRTCSRTENGGRSGTARQEHAKEGTSAKEQKERATGIGSPGKTAGSRRLVPVASTEPLGGMIPALGRTRKSLGAVVLTLYATCASVMLRSVSATDFCAVNGPRKTSSVAGATSSSVGASAAGAAAGLDPASMSARRCKASERTRARGRRERTREGANAREGRRKRASGSRKRALRR